ncbi:MAG: DUF1566 domain-containing protein [Nitrospira sp.]|nr:DUF1566 domain-containing protein [Nitrospira sp.]
MRMRISKARATGGRQLMVNVWMITGGRAMLRQPRPYRLILGVLLLGLLGGAVLPTGLVQAASGVGPFYPEPAWDRKLPASTRFFILTNWSSQAVLDKETGLVWERSPATTLHNWSAAGFECTSRTTGNRKGWRLPSVHELASLVDPSVTPGPTLPSGHPFTNVQSANYWSATTNAALPANAFLVTFLNGNVGGPDKSFNNRAWCVRGGMNADAY